MLVPNGSVALGPLQWEILIRPITSQRGANNHETTICNAHGSSLCTRGVLHHTTAYYTRDPCWKLRVCVERPREPGTNYNLSHLVLRSDGTYDLVEGGTTKTVSEKKGVWRVEPGTPSDHVDVVLDHSGYPVEVKRNEVRLLIDLDTGVWWVKLREKGVRRRDKQEESVL